MRPFTYHRAGNQVEAADMTAASSRAMLLAGGTNLIDLMKEGIAAPTQLVDLNALEGLRVISTAEDGALVLGALATNAAVARDPAVLGSYPLLSEALLSGATPQIRNAATVAGNLLQSNRCPSYWDKSQSCTLRNPVDACAGREGVGVNRAIFAPGPCVAVFPSDMATALLAFDATLQIATSSGTSEMSLCDFYRRDDRGLPLSGLPVGALVTHVRLPATPFRAGQAYVKVRERASFAFAIVSVAVALRVENGRICAVRVTAGSVADRPWRMAEAEAELLGREPSMAIARDAAELAMKLAQPLASDHWKCTVLRGAIIKALTVAIRRETGEVLA